MGTEREQWRIGGGGATVKRFLFILGSGEGSERRFLECEEVDGGKRLVLHVRASGSSEDAWELELERHMAGVLTGSLLEWLGRGHGVPFGYAQGQAEQDA